MTNQGLIYSKVHVYLIREARAILTGLSKHECTRNYFGQELFGNGIENGIEYEFFGNGIENGIEYEFFGKGENGIEFGIEHHANSTPWYKVTYVTFYSLVHIFMETLRENSKVGNNNF